jgi:hypothetical protein
MPEGLNKIEQALDDRWGHLGEEVLTTSSVNPKGEMVFYDKELKPAVRSDGSIVWVQAAHRAYQFKGKVITSVDRKPIVASIDVAKKLNNGYFSRLLRDGLEVDRDNMPAAKSPGGK